MVCRTGRLCLRRSGGGRKPTSPRPATSLISRCAHSRITPRGGARSGGSTRRWTARTRALREGRRAVGLLPDSKDAWDGPAVASNLAAIYARTGEKGLALQELDRLVRQPGGNDVQEVSYGGLKLDPRWGPVARRPAIRRARGHPRTETVDILPLPEASCRRTFRLRMRPLESAVGHTRRFIRVFLVLGASLAAASAGGGRAALFPGPDSPGRDADVRGVRPVRGRSGRVASGALRRVVLARQPPVPAAPACCPPPAPAEST